MPDSHEEHSPRHGVNESLLPAPTCFNWILWYAAIVHLLWALMAYLNPAAHAATPLAATYEILNGFGLGEGWIIPLYVVVSLLAMEAMRRCHRELWHFGLLAPQQIVMMLAAFSAMRAIVSGQYADGIPRPWEFIVADQFPQVIATILHTLCICELYLFHKRGGGR